MTGPVLLGDGASSVVDIRDPIVLAVAVFVAMAILIAMHALTRKTR